jgi:hypothetical protein
MEALDRLLSRLVGFGDAFVLPQVLEPGFHEERFQHASFFGSILKHAPRIGAVAATLLAELFDGGEKRQSRSLRKDLMLVNRGEGPVCRVCATMIRREVALDAPQSRR